MAPDGSRQRQVTTDGTSATTYGSPSQADDGTILSRYGQVFVRLRPDGTKLGAPIPAVGSDSQHRQAPRVGPRRQARRRAGTLRVMVPLNRRGRTALRRAKRLKLTVTVRITAPGGAQASATRTVTMRR